MASIIHSRMRTLSPPEKAERPESQEQCHGAKNYEVGELGKPYLAEGGEEADHQTADRSSSETAAFADDVNRQAIDQDLGIGAGIKSEECTTQHATKAGQRGAQHKSQEKKPADVDAAMKLGCNHPMGPLELLDFVGLDVALATITGIYENMSDSKYRPCPLFVKMVEAGWLGRKSGRGFYNYSEKK